MPLQPLEYLGDMENSYTEQEWDYFLNQKFKVYQAEEFIYINSIDRSILPESYAKIICDALRNGDVPHALRVLYREAVYGTNEKVKARIKKRMYFIRIHCR